MVTAKNLITNSKAELGCDNKDADYTSCRNAVEEYYSQHSMSSLCVARGGEKSALIAVALRMTGFRPAIGARVGSGSEFYQKARQILLRDYLKQKFETAKNLAI